MKDSTVATRLDRATADLQVAITTLSNLLGRFEMLLGNLPPSGENPAPPGEPPTDYMAEIKEIADRRYKDRLGESLERAEGE
jgi:outer membrane protein TolC